MSWRSCGAFAIPEARPPRRFVEFRQLGVVAAVAAVAVVAVVALVTVVAVVAEVTVIAQRVRQRGVDCCAIVSGLWKFYIVCSR